jgi:hypothetical protein
MNRLIIKLCDSNGDGNLKYRFTVLNPNGRILIMTSSMRIAESYIRK